MKRLVWVVFLLLIVTLASVAVVRWTRRGTEDAPGGALSRLSLRNATYRSNGTENGTVRLTGGRFEDAPAHVWVTMLDEIAYGDVTGNGRADAAVVLATNTGGSGVFHSLAVVQDVDGEPVNVAAADLGDRIKVEALAVEGDRILVAMIAHGPGDPFCCPTLPVTRAFAYVNGTLEMREQIPPDLEAAD
jgi:hypothetical protein